MAKRADKTASILIYPSTRGDIPFALVFRYHQKHINIRITHGGEVKVSAPYGSSMKRVFSAVESKEQWIRGHMQKVDALLDAFDPRKMVLYQGVTHRVATIYDSSRVGVVRHIPEAKALNVLTKFPDTIDSVEIIGKWLKRQAKVLIRERVDRISEAIRIPVNKVYLRDQRSRWGSSSSMGNVSLNWRAVMLPRAVSDYLIIHELAHQQYLDHSSLFWELVERLCPNYRQYEAFLKRHSTLLALFR